MNSADLRHDAKVLVSGIVIGALIMVMACVWQKYKPAIPSVLAPTAPAVANIKMESMPCTTVRAFKEPAKKKLGMPESVQKDEHASVLAAAQVPPSDYPRTATAILHRDTGIGEIYLRDEPLPWLAFNRRGSVGIAYGFKDNADGFVTRLYGRFDLVQIKRLHAGLLGDVDNAGGWYGGGFAEVRW